MINQMDWNRINRRKGLTMQDFQKTLLTGIVTTIATMFVSYLFLLPKFQAETAINYEYVIKSIDSYNQTMATLTAAAKEQREAQDRANKELSQSNNEMKIDIAVIKNNVEFVKEIANTKVKTLEGRLTALEYRAQDRAK